MSKVHGVKQTKHSRIIYLSVVIGIVLINAVMLILISSKVKSYTLLQSERSILQSAQRAPSASDTLSEDDKRTLETLSEVFPDEESMPTFVSELETLIRSVTNAYSIRFNSLTPIPEQDKLFLLMTLTVSTDLDKLSVFLQGLESLPYMTHVVSISQKSPEGFGGNGEVRIGLKVYVKNPFTNN